MQQMPSQVTQLQPVQSGGALKIALGALAAVLVMALGVGGYVATRGDGNSTVRLHVLQMK